MAEPAVVVGAAEAGGFDLDDHAAICWLGVGEGGDDGRLAKLGVVDGAHADSLPGQTLFMPCCPAGSQFNFDRGAEFLTF